MKPEREVREVMELAAMDVEWNAWRGVCKALDVCGVNIDKEDALARAIQRWGDALVALRKLVP